MSALGVRRNSWTGLCGQPEAFPVFNRTECAKRDLDPFLVVPANVRVNDLNELVGADVARATESDEVAHGAVRPRDVPARRHAGQPQADRPVYAICALPGIPSSNSSVNGRAWRAAVEYAYDVVMRTASAPAPLNQLSSLLDGRCS